MIPNLSIIIPVYNAEKTLSFCIERIISQSFSKWELILVNDGSCDSSGEICDKYALKDDRIHVIHKKNGGVSSARNIGINISKGQWITFIDADDYISEDYLCTIEYFDEDIIIVQNKHFKKNEESYIYEYIDDLYTVNISKTREFIGSHLHYNIMLVPWGKFYKRELIKNLRFKLGQRLGEDTIFVHSYLKKCNTIRVTNNASYNYFQTLSDKYFMSIDDSFIFLTNIYNAYKKLGIKSPNFCLFELNLFTKLSSNEIKENPLIWYKSKLIKDLYEESKILLSIKDKLKFKIFSLPLGYFAYSYISTKVINKFCNNKNIICYKIKSNEK